MQTLNVSKLKPQHHFVTSLSLYVVGTLLVHYDFHWGSLFCLAAILWPTFLIAKFLWKRPGSIFWLLLLGFLGLVLILCFAWSASVYAKLFASFVPASTPYVPQGFDWALSQLPIVGGLFVGLGWIITGVVNAAQGSLFGAVGVILFILCQAAETGVVFIEDFLPLRKWMIRTAGRFANMAVPESSPAYVKQWAKKYNQSPARILQNLRYASYVAYAVDALVCAMAAPIIVGGYSQWETIRYTFNGSHIDGANVLVNIITVIGFTLIAKLTVLVLNALSVFFGWED